MTVKKTHLLRNSVIIMLVFAIAGLALTYVKFFGNPDPTAATATPHDPKRIFQFPF